jgi:hypothetical protein
MKKTLLVLSILTLFTIGAQAQKAGLGIKGGLNFANVDAAGDPESKTGFHAGIYGEFGVGGFALMPEVLISTKGAEDFDLTYIEIPILLKKSFAKVLNVHLGPQFGLLTSADSDGIDFKEAMKGSDLSAVFGAGVDLPGGLSAGARYVLGLSDIRDSDFALGNDKVKNKTFQIYVGYKLFGK